jgi:hypothetical protein
MQVSVPCPHCNWREINGDFVKYDKDTMKYNMRCTRCNCLFEIDFMVDLKIVREGSKNYA